MLQAASESPPTPRVDVLGCLIDPIDMSETIERCLASVDEIDRCVLQVSINVAKVVECSRNPGMAAHIASCDVISADGQGVVWAARLLGRPVPERVAGIDLMQALLAEAERRDLGVYVLGARREVLDMALERIRQRHPTLRVVGAHDGWFSIDQEDAVVTSIRAAAPELLFVAMSSPQKEEFLERHRHDIGAGFAMGVGGSVDVIAGVTKRAPVSIQRLGLEWAYRLVQEPRRLWRRYLVGNARFAWLLIRQLARRAR